MPAWTVVRPTFAGYVTIDVAETADEARAIARRHPGAVVMLQVAAARRVVVGGFLMDGAHVNGPSGAIGFVAIPACLRPVEATRRWVGWRWEQRGDKWDKPPRIVIGGRANGYAKSDDPDTWATLRRSEGGPRRRAASPASACSC